MKEIMRALFKFLSDRFSLAEDKADELQITNNIKRDVYFKGTHLWTLIFAIMVASVGLNVNSTAVIIGAMLISPIMGPIMGIGLGTATNNFDLMRLGFKNWIVAAIISIITSAIYFYITPLHEVNSELLARTNPSIWDVLIAFFGGLAGIVASTRQQTSNVIPGVAIATALMPPLCTAGYGLASGNWIYFIGALYLFFINSLFICLATFLIVKHLRFKKYEFESEQRARKIRHIIWIVVTLAVLPSIYLTYRIVQREIFETNANNFVRNEFNFARTQVINKKFSIQGRKKIIELLVVGQELSKEQLDALESKKKAYKLGSADLVVLQGLNAKQQIDIAQIRASILEDVFQKEKQEDESAVSASKSDTGYPDISRELKALYPEMIYYSLTRTVNDYIVSGKKDTFCVFAAKFKTAPRKVERIRLKSWLDARFKPDSIKIQIE